MLIGMLKSATRQPSTPCPGDQEGQDRSPFDIPFSAIHCFYQSDLCIAQSVGNRTTFHFDLVEFRLAVSRHIFIQSLPNFRDILANVHSSQCGRHFSIHRTIPREPICRQCLIHQMQGLHRKIIPAKLWVQGRRHWNSRRNSSGSSLLSIRLGGWGSLSRRPDAQCDINLLIPYSDSSDLSSPVSTSIVSTFAPGAAVTRSKAVGRTKDSTVANRIRSWRVSGTPPARCNAINEACTPSLLTSSTVRPLKAATSTAS